MSHTYLGQYLYQRLIRRLIRIHEKRCYANRYSTSTGHYDDDDYIQGINGIFAIPRTNRITLFTYFVINRTVCSNTKRFNITLNSACVIVGIKQVAIIVISHQRSRVMKHVILFITYVQGANIYNSNTFFM